MNIQTNILLICIFTFIILIVGVPGLNTTNLIQNKLFLFMCIFIFQLLLRSISNIKKNCSNVTIKDIMNDALSMATSSVLGYSIFIDLLNMAETRNYIIEYTNNKYTHSIMISVIIAIFCLFTKIITLLLSNNASCN